MKKILALLALVLPMLTAAQSLEGTWKIHPSVLLTAATDLIDTEHYVYALSNKSLMRLDKDALQIESMSQANGLNDVTIQNIYYNYDNAYLLVAYVNGNIDILMEDGSIVNVSDIKDVVMTGNKTINDVNFADGKAWIATSFGMAVIDDATKRIVEFRNYNKSLNSVLKVGDRTVIAYEDSLYTTTNKRETLNDFTGAAVKQAAPKLRPINDDNLFVYGTGKLMRCAITDTGFVATTIVAVAPNNVQRTVNGWLANFRSSKYYYTIANDANFTAKKVTTNSTINLYSRHPDDASMWVVNNNGIFKNGTTAYYKPNALYLRTSIPLWYSLYNPWDNRFYVTSGDQNYVLRNTNTAQFKVHIFSYNDASEWSEVTPTPMVSWGTGDGNRLGRLAFIPGMSNSYVFGNRNGAIYRVLNGVVSGTFQNTYTTSALKFNHTQKINEPGLLFDQNQNLWLVAADNSPSKKAIMMLPWEKVLADAVDATDWITYDAAAFNLPSFQRQSFVVGKDNVLVYCSGDNSSQLNIFKPKADNTNELDFLVSKSFADQTGTQINWYNNYVHAMAADSTGNVWVGGSVNKLFYFNPTEAFSDNFRVTTPVATGDEETPYDMEVTSIAVDAQNRKWVGTREAGLFVISPDGSQILKRFNTDNSNLPSPFVYTVDVSPTSAMVVTENGVAEYSMSEIPQVVDYTAVTAAPMVVDPSFTGFVTIGLVEVGACVRITDRDGNLVREYTATSNQVGWDTCLEDGTRVPTGIYNIYAGRSADQLPATPQARVRVISMILPND